eukprot:TRINITY_DN56287_c0_g1_i1.p2 TRINITY_DN56287_c0_g1~~TRINITY_DN56287_c0_g1_i1.p2  ORF type:complete len:196 (+),score=69.12 TRINITY_DN56287_c0_g1_i1:80-589(+)
MRPRGRGALAATAPLLDMSTPRWMMGSWALGDNAREPWHAYPEIYGGEGRRERRFVPSFTKEEKHFDRRSTYVTRSKYLAGMLGGPNFMRPTTTYERTYEQPGLPTHRKLFKQGKVPLWPDRRLMPAAKGWMDERGLWHDDPERILQFTPPDMRDCDFRPYVAHDEGGS